MGAVVGAGIIGAGFAISRHCEFGAAFSVLSRGLRYGTSILVYKDDDVSVLCAITWAQLNFHFVAPSPQGSSSHQAVNAQLFLQVLQVPPLYLLLQPCIISTHGKAKCTDTMNVT